MAQKYVIARGPLHGHIADSNTRPRFKGSDAFAVGLVLTATGYTFKEPTGRTWIQARTPWMVETGRGEPRWFASDYLKDITETPNTPVGTNTIAGVLARWVLEVEGKRLDVDGRHGAQCVDGSKDWVRLFGADPEKAYGNGIDFAKGLCNRYPDLFTFYGPDQTRVQAGDTISLGRPYGVSSSGVVYGHTAIALGPSVGGRIPVIQQDGFNAGTTMYRGNVRANALVGVARPKAVPQVADTTKNTTHTVVAGDTYWGLSKKYGISVAALRDLNPTVDPNDLRVGQKLVVAR